MSIKLLYNRDIRTMPDTIVAAYRRATVMEAENFPGEKCAVVVESDGANWKITVTRASDSSTAIETLPKE